MLADQYKIHETTADRLGEGSRTGYMQRRDRDELPDLCYYVNRELFTEVV